MRCLDLPERTGAEFEVAMDVASVPGDPAVLGAHGWRITDPLAVSIDPWRYRDYLRGSRGEFTVAKDLNIRLRSGWFSDRAACYLAAGRPAVVQDTAWTKYVPAGKGLFAFNTMEEALAGLDEVMSDPIKHRDAAYDIAREYLAPDRVLPKMIEDILRTVLVP